MRLSEPRQGLSLATATEERAIYVRKAVESLAHGFDDNNRLLNSFTAIFGPRWELDIGYLGYHNKVNDLKARAAWNLVSTWLLAQASGVISSHSSLSTGEEWFIGDSQIPNTRLSSLVSSETLNEAHHELQKVPIDQDFWDLLPYVLEEHGPGSRSSVLRNPNTKSARLAKRRHGVFYTPSDVADYMVQHALDNYPFDATHALSLDPSCGTGVFLLSLCRCLEKKAIGEHFDRFGYVIHNLYGCDISAHAIEACAFVLLQHCLLDVCCYGISPWAAWHAIRLNLATLDSLTLNSSELGTPSSARRRSTILEEKREALLERGAGWVDHFKETPKVLLAQRLSPPLLPSRRMIEVGELFGEAGHGFSILIGNPPYSSLGKRPDFDLLTNQYQCLARSQLGPRQNTFLLFTEMMWKLTLPGQNSSAIVTPLSVAYNHEPQYRDCRKAMSQQGGQWQFAFFDREPHALFGEEVKTRNAILFRFENNSTPSRGKVSVIETGPLRKWTSRTRKQLFESIQFTSLGAIDIGSTIPKVEGSLQVEAYAILRHKHKFLQSLCRKIGTCNLRSALSPSQTNNHIFVGGTAYNFLNVFRTFSLNDSNTFPLSESPVHCLEFASESDTALAFAVLSSRVVFWLWRVEADGFHVPSWFIRNIPFCRESFSHEQTNRMMDLGTRLWEAVQAHRFSSVNRSKATYTFRPLLLNEERDAIDSILISAAELPSDFSRELKEFVRTTVVVDENDTKRRHLQNYFSEELNQCLPK